MFANVELIGTRLTADPKFIKDEKSGDEFMQFGVAANLYQKSKGSNFTVFFNCAWFGSRKQMDTPAILSLKKGDVINYIRGSISSPIYVGKSGNSIGLRVGWDGFDVGAKVVNGDNIIHKEQALPKQEPKKEEPPKQQAPQLPNPEDIGA